MTAEDRQLVRLAIDAATRRRLAAEARDVRQALHALQNDDTGLASERARTGMDPGPRAHGVMLRPDEEVRSPTSDPSFRDRRPRTGERRAPRPARVRQGLTAAAGGRTLTLRIQGCSSHRAFSVSTIGAASR